MRTLIALFILFPFLTFSQINKTDENGLRQGLWQKRGPNNKLLYEGHFKDGKPIGEWKRYHEGGQLKANISYKGDTAITQLYDIWRKKVAEGIYINQRKEGIWAYFSNNRLISEEEFRDGIKTGISRKFYDTGETMETCDWKDGKMEGQYQLYFKTGEPYLQCKMKNNQRDGLCIIYFRNGRQELIANYKNGLRNGEWEYRNEQGEFLYKLYYDSGKLLNPEVRDSLDNIQMQLLEKNRALMLDPEKFMQDPSEYMMKLKIYR